MGIQTMGSQTNGQQQSHLQPCFVRQSSRYNLTLNEVENQLGNLGKPLGSMDLDELLKNLRSTEANASARMDENIYSASSPQRQASLTLARSWSGKTVDQVWREIQQGQKKRFRQEMQSYQREPTLGEMTLKDFLVQAGLFAEVSISPVDLDTVGAVTMQSFPQHLGLLHSASIGSLSSAGTPGQKGDDDAIEKSIDSRLRRKIKNRQSAARSRARKQAYHNELVNKVSRLEEENLKLKKEKEFEKLLPSESLPEPRYQLRRMNSASL